MQNSYRESIHGSLSYCTPPMNIYRVQGVSEPVCPSPNHSVSHSFTQSIIPSLRGVTIILCGPKFSNTASYRKFFKTTAICRNFCSISY